MNVFLQRIATAVPAHDVHGAFVSFASAMLQDDRTRTLFLRMADRAEITQRYSALNASGEVPAGDVDAYEFYRRGDFPRTAERMKLFEQFAPVLMRQALDSLRLSDDERSSIGHVLVTCCTGMYAPGLDFAVLDHLSLPRSTERTHIGFMGCYAAMNALKVARHIVRSTPERRVLMINLELCTLHFQETQDLGEVLSFLVFADGCAASLIGSEPRGFSLDSFDAMEIPNTRELITWSVRDAGFDMVLSGRVPGEIGKTLRANRDTFAGTEMWAVHPGGRSVLDAVQEGLALPPEALRASREVLCCYGNMSSATVMFVLAELLKSACPGETGCAMSFGPGLTAEILRFHAA